MLNQPGTALSQFAEIGSPFLAHGGFMPQALKESARTLIDGGKSPCIETVLVQRFLDRIDLGLGHLNFRFADLGEIARGDVSRQQSDDHDHHQQLEQRETRSGARTPS